MFKSILVTLFILLISGCTNWETFQAVVDNHGRTVSDEELQSLEWAFCLVPREGAVQRRYGENPAKMAARAKICAGYWVAK